MSIGLLRATPPAIVNGFVLASLVPYNHVSVTIAFGLGIALGVATLIRYRTRLRDLALTEFRKKGFYLLLALVAYAMVLWVSRLGDSTDSWSFLALASSLLTVPFGVYSLSYLEWTGDGIVRALRLLTYTGIALVVVALLFPALSGDFTQYPQAFFVVFKTIRSVMPLPFEMQWVDPDFNRVSLTSSHYFAAVMLIFSGAMSAMALNTKRYIRYCAGSFAGIFCFALGENAHILPGAAVGIVAVVLVAQSRRVNAPAGAASGMVIACAVCCIALVVSTLYFHGGRYSLSQKGVLYAMVKERAESDPVRFLFGEGPAAFASRAANKRMPQQRMEIEYAFPFAIPEFASPMFMEMVDRSEHAERGSTMKRPLSGAAGILMEWGVFGSLLIIVILFRLIRSAVRTIRSTKRSEIQAAAYTAVFGLVMITVSLSVRTYFEYPEITSVAASLLMLAVAADPGARYPDRVNSNIWKKA